MDNCLGCMACMTACPSGVEYNKLIEPRAPRLSAISRAARRCALPQVIFATFPYPAASAPARHACPHLSEDRASVPWFAPAAFSSCCQSVWRRWRRFCPHVPSFFSDCPPRHAASEIPTQPRRRVGMLSGCVQQVFFPHVNAATARVLAAEGCEVMIPRDQPCCGALMVHSGLEDRGRRDRQEDDRCL